MNEPIAPTAATIVQRMPPGVAAADAISDWKRMTASERTEKTDIPTDTETIPTGITGNTDTAENI